MNSSEISKLCIDSAEKYYKYLADNDLGLDEIRITDKKKIEDSDFLWVLKIGGRVFNFEILTIKNLRHNLLYNENHFTVESYDAERNRLVIRINDKMTNFKETPANQLLLISDLKFLVENVRKWYVANGSKINLPKENTTRIAYSQLECAENPNKNQILAIETCLNEPFCYVWGPPGSGKTKLVLASAVLSYYDKEKPFRIGVFAPTNNSLEQVMATLVLLGDKIGIPREKFFRLGTPTQLFATEFPEVCEVAGLEKSRKELKNQIRIFNEILKHRKEQGVLNSSESLLQSLFDIGKSIEQKDKELLAFSKLEKEIAVLKKKRTSIAGIVKKIISSKDKTVQKHISDKAIQCQELKEHVEKLENDIELSFAKIKRVQIENKNIKTLVEMLSLQNMEQTKEKICEAINTVKEHLMVRTVHALDYKESDENEINSRKKELEDGLSDLDLHNIEERVKGSFVVGSTLDTYISRFQRAKLTLNHIFIDEAGYVPLIKALVLCEKDVPITFLGDHKQLPPVCEMNEQELANPLFKNGILWSASALYCGSAFAQSQDKLLDNLRKNDPEMHEIKKAELLITHRFGSNLAEILDRLFYQFGFKSAFENDDDCVELFVVDAPFMLGVDGRRSLSEGMAIQKLLEKVSMSDFAILTPYKDQVALINKFVPSLKKEGRVLTVHKSQGREWDTVIMSIVDGRGCNPWFTDTLNSVSKGSQVMNTAISRVKKKLYIVCDKAYWLKREDRERQLVSNLIAKGKPLNLN